MSHSSLGPPDPTRPPVVTDSGDAAGRAFRDESAERLSRLQAVIAGVKDYAVISIDAAGRIDGWNVGAADTFGWTERQAVGQPFDFIWTPEDVAAGRPGVELRAAMTDGMAVNNRWHRRADGSTVFVTGATRPVFDAAGRPGGFVKVCRDETVQRRAADALADAQTRYRQLFDSIDEGFCTIQMIFEGGVAVDYRFLEVNPAFEAQTGLAGATGRTVREMVPRHDPHWFDVYGRVATTGIAARFEHAAEALGRRFDVYATRVGRPDACTVAVVFRDITARHRAEEALAAERELLRTVFEQAPDDAVLVMDAGRTLTAWNPAAERIIGWTAAEAVGRSADLIFTPEDRAANVPVQETTAAAAKGKTADERWHVRKNGSRFWGSGTMNALHHADGTVRGYLKVFRDATERHEQAQTLAFLNRVTGAFLSVAGGGAGTHPDGVIADVQRMLGEHLSASRVLLAEASPDGQSVTIGSIWSTPGMPELALTHRLADYGDRLLADYASAGLHLRRDANREYPPGPELDALRAIRAIAAIDVPVLMNGRLRALLSVHQSTPRDWTEGEIALVRQVADRLVAEIERARAAAVLRASEAESRFLADLGEATRRMSDPDAVLAVTVERLRQQLGVARCAYAEVDADQDGIEIRYDAATPGTPSVAGRFRLASFGPRLLAELRVGRTVAVADVTTDPLVDGGGVAMAAVGVAAVVNVPLVKDARVVAVLAVHESRPRAWTAGEVRLIEAVAERSWAEVERARALRGLRASEARQAYLVRLADTLRPLTDPAEMQAAASVALGLQLQADRAVYFEVDGDDYVVEREYANGLRPIRGRYPTASFGEALLAAYRAGRTFVSLDTAADPALSPDQRHAFAAIQSGAFVGVPLVKRRAFVAGLTVHAAGPRQWTADERSLVEETAERLWAAIQRARDSRAVLESEARLSALVRASSNFLYRMNPDWSELWELKGGGFLADADRPNRSWLDDYVHPDDRPRVMAAVAEAIAGRQAFELEHRVLKVDGTVGWISSRAVPFFAATGAITEWFGAASDITGRKQAEAERERSVQELAVSERRRRMAAEAADVGSFNLDPATGVLESDTQFRRLFGGSDAPLSYAQVFALIHPDDRDGVRARVAAAIDPADGRPYAAEHRVVHPDGAVRWLAARGRCSFAGDGAGRRAVSFDGTVLDVSDRKRAEAALAFQQHQMELIFQESPAGMALWSGEDLVFERVNPEYQNLFRGRPLVGLPLLEALPELRGQGFDDLLRHVMRTGEPHVGRETPARLRTVKDGPIEDRYYDFSFLQVKDADGKPWGVYDHSIDVTDRVRGRLAVERSESQLRTALADRERLLESERTARAEAEQAGRMKDEFLATLSHELRTPLNAIVGWTQILQSIPGNAPDVEEGLAVIARNARAQTKIIEDILDMSRIISGKMRLDVQQVDLAALVRAGADTVQPAAAAKQVRVRVRVDPAAGLISGDPGRLHQVFWNLVSNAVKFTPKDGRVQVLLERVDSHVEVSVSDTGEGIDSSFLPHVFDRFRQADASTTRRHGGLGLGLAIAKQIVEMHGGHVRVKSPGVGQGTTFTVSLPLTVVHSEAQAPPVPRDHPAQAVPLDVHRTACDQLAGVSVVAVDDEPDGVAMIQRLLAECGANVRTATSAAEALALIQADPPAVLVSDIGMPGQDGYALIRAVRALPAAQGNAVRALALTAYARATDRVRALEAGFQMHLAKPVEPGELIVTVEALAKMTVL